MSVLPVNDAPWVADPIPDAVVDEDAAPTTISLDHRFEDVDIHTNGDWLSFSVVGNTNPDLVSTSCAGLDLSLSFGPDQNGEAEVTVRATDRFGAFTEDTFTVTVNAVNDAPVAVDPIADVDVDEDAAPTVIDLADVFGDVDIVTNGDSLSLSVVSNTNEGLVEATLDGTELTLSYLANQYGTVEVTVRATDTPGAHVEDTFTLTVHPVIDAVIDIKPGGDANPINLKSNGVLPVAILTTSRADGEIDDFDATTVDPTSILFGDARDGYGRAAPTRFSYEDVDHDGDVDLILHFLMQDIRSSGALAEDSTNAVLTAELFSNDALGIDLIGFDVLKIVPSKGNGKGGK